MVGKTTFFGIVLCLIISVTFYTSTIVVLASSNETESKEQNEILETLKTPLPIITTGDVTSIKNAKTPTSGNTVPSDAQQNGSAVVIASTGSSLSTIEKTSTFNDTQPNGSEPASQNGSAVVIASTMSSTSTVEKTSTFNDTQPNGSEPASQSTIVSKTVGKIAPNKLTTAYDGASVTQSSDYKMAPQSTIVNKADEKPTTMSGDADVTQSSAHAISTTVLLQSEVKIATKSVVEDGHFLLYLILGSLLLSVVYIVYHNKNKIISLCQKDGPKRTRRPKASEYQRLDQNLSEVITSLKKKTNLKMN